MTSKQHKFILSLLAKRVTPQPLDEKIRTLLPTFSVEKADKCIKYLLEQPLKSATSAPTARTQ